MLHIQMFYPSILTSNFPFLGSKLQEYINIMSLLVENVENVEHFGFNDF